ncbi:putative oxidoreductase [Pasteurella langaaensis DSM 22999]|uniref:Putative oxidoreductase n=1 Tax=Alitibacter langaaensis DSM 22999 TaxID=1122935 RepID=A0A2U0SL43_9PAST|nr:DoxX family protein [Pasteurella langaaensis]PVX32061.1 putative oxidoreductase [Pasteurella langaaensis DSM 22999]
MTYFINRFNQIVDAPELAKLILRLAFAGMFMLHGIHKLIGGVDFVAGKFIELGLPGFLAHAAYLGEIIAPILIILGIFTRLSAFVSLISCAVIVVLMHSHDFFTLTKVGAWSVEAIATFFTGFLAIMLLGSGKYALKAD